MKYLFTITILAIFAATVNTGCKKSSVKPTIVDSLEIHRAAGWGGGSIHCMITPAQAKLGKYGNGNDFMYDSLLSADKHDRIKDMLDKVPKGMLTHNHSAPPLGNDLMEQWVVSYKDGAKYTYYFLFDKHKYSSFETDVNNAILTLSGQ